MDMTNTNGINMGKQIAKRSIGVTVLGFLFIISPISHFLISIFYYHNTLQPLQYFFILFSIIIGINILLLKEWARKFVIIFAILLIFLSLTSFFIIPEVIFKNNFNLITNFWMLIYGSLLLYFFTRLKIKEQFRKT